MEKILKYKSWFLAIGMIITFTFSQRFLNNPWAEYAGETLVAIGVNMESSSATKGRMEKSVSITPLPLYSSLDYGYV